MQLKLKSDTLDALSGGAVFANPLNKERKHGLGVVWLVFGYNPTEEAKEIGTELKSSRNQIIIGLIASTASFIGGALIAPRIERYFNKEEYEEIEDE